MKHVFSFIALVAIAINSIAQEKLYIHKNDGSIIEYLVSEVDSINFVKPQVQPRPVFTLENIAQDKLLEMTQGYNKFAWNYLTTVASAETEKDKNCFICPFGMGIDWAMLQNGALDNTLQEIINTIGFSNYTQGEINGFYKKLTERLLSSDSSIVNVANIMITNIEEGLYLDSTFSSALTTHYNANCQSRVFNQETTDELNNWCKEQTYGKIEKVIDELKGAFILADATYLKSRWIKPLDILHSPFNFTAYDSTITTLPEYMSSPLVSYSEDEKMQYVEIPLWDGFAVFFALPAQGESIANTASHLANNYTQIIDSLRNNYKEQKFAIVSLPKFSVQYSLENDNMKNVLKEMGIKSVFDASYSNLGNISADRRPLYIGNVIQKTNFDIDENGIEAAAITAIIGENGSGIIPDPILIELNRPFIYGIKDSRSGAILFNGCMYKLSPANN